MAAPAPTAAYKDALLALQAQQRARLSVLVQQTEAMLHSDWQRGMGAAASLYRPVLDEYAKALNALRIANDDPAAKLSLDWLTSQNSALKSIEQSVRASALTYGNESVKTVEDAQLKAMNAGLQDAENLTQEALFPASQLGVNPAMLFNRPNPDAISQFVGRAGNGHPLGDLFSNFPQEATSAARQAMLMGLATGANPVSMAHGISQAMGISRSRAIVISRTEVLGSYRSASHEVYRANSDVLGYWLWSAGGANPCFPAGTLITTTRGKVPIEDVKIGDEVLTHLRRFQPVTETMQRIYSGIMVTMRDPVHAVAATGSHPFLVWRWNRNEWVNAEDIKTTDLPVMLFDQLQYDLLSLWDNSLSRHDAQGVTVYNLEVKEDHTYVANDFVVHNCAMCAGMDGTLHDLSEDLVDHPCFPAGMLVSGPKALGSTTRWYEGDLVDIVTRDGRFLSVTPNHPILTPHGWIMAGLLEEGDDVVCHRFSERGHTSAVGVPDDYQVPTPIEQIAGAFGSAGNVAAVAMPLAAEDLNRQRWITIKGKVNIVWPNGVLRHTGNGRDARRQPRAQKRFAWRDAYLTLLTSLGAANLLPQRLRFAMHGRLSGQHDATILLGRASISTDARSLRHGTALNASGQQPHINGAPRDAERLSERQLRFAREIAPHDLRVGQTLLGPLRHSITRADQAIARLTISQQPPSLERLRKALVTGVEPGSYHFDALPGDICLDRIFKISIREFRGHVYNLQTLTGWYVTSSIITHNCGRCAPVPVTKPWSDILGPYGIDASGLDETSIGAPGNYTSISEKFASYSPAKQREIIGTQTGYEAYKRGELTLKDFIGVRPASDGFPSSYYQKSLKELQIPTRQASRLVQPAPEIVEKLRLGTLRYTDLGKITPDELMPAWAKRNEASRIVYQILRNGLPYDMTSHERGLLITNLAEMLKTDLPVSERAAVERQLQALGGQVERLTLKGTKLAEVGAEREAIQGGKSIADLVDMHAPAADMPRVVDEANARIAARLADNLAWQDYLTRSGLTPQEAAEQFGGVFRGTLNVNERSGAGAGAMMRAVRDEFGLTKASLGYVEQFESAAELYAEEGPALRAYVRAAYEETQQYLRENGITEVTLYRGGPIIETEKPFVSYSVDREYAAIYAQAEDYPGIPADQITLREVTLPADQILGLPQTGIGNQLEGEVVALGQRPAQIATERDALAGARAEVRDAQRALRAAEDAVRADYSRSPQGLLGNRLLDDPRVVSAQARLEAAQVRVQELRQIDQQAAKVAPTIETEATKSAETALAQQAAEHIGVPDVSPTAEYAKTVHANQKSDVAWFADMHGMSVKEYEDAVAAKIQAAVDADVVSIRYPQSSLEKILDDGYFKTVHASGRTEVGYIAQDPSLERVQMYIGMRAKYEEEAFGYPLDLAPELRPVSGYIAPLTEDDAAARGFGDARIVLKNEVRDRSTMTVSDSLQNDHVLPRPMNAIRYDVVPFAAGKERGFPRDMWASMIDPLSKGDLSDTPLAYMEAQIHGGLKSSDIAEVIFNDGHIPSEALQAKLADAGIPWRMESDAKAG